MSVTEMGGSLSVRSPGLGQGATFSLLLPLCGSREIEQQEEQPSALAA